MEAGQNLAPPAASEVPEAKPQGFFARLIGVLFSPGETFVEIVRAPRVIAPIIAAIVLGLVVSFAMTRRLDFQAMYSQLFEQAVAQGRMQQEQAEQQAKTMARFGPVQFLVFGSLGSLLSALIVAGIFKGVSAVMGKDNSFKALFAVTLYTFLAVGIISSLVFVISLYLKDPSEITFQNLGNLVASNLGAVLALALGADGLPRFVMGLAQRVDVFSIWIIVLLSIGYAAATPRLKTSTAATWLVVLYVVYALIAAAFGTLQG